MIYRTVITKYHTNKQDMVWGELYMLLNRRPKDDFVFCKNVTYKCSEDIDISYDLEGGSIHCGSIATGP